MVPRVMAETKSSEQKPGQQKMASPFGPLLWILAPLIIILAYGLIWKI
jgi:hypothetical protein